MMNCEARRSSPVRKGYVRTGNPMSIKKRASISTLSTKLCDTMKPDGPLICPAILQVQ